jgi:hypothetical protein
MVATANDDDWAEVEVEVEVKLGPTVSRSVRPGVGLPSRAHAQIIFLTIAVFLTWGTLSEERTSL